MTWWTIYRTADGVCLGHTSIEPTQTPALTTVVQHAVRMDQTNLWNATARVWGCPTPVPVTIDRLQDLVNHPYLSDVWSRLTAAQRTKLRKTVVWLLASRRRREPLEDVPLNPDTGWPTDPSLAVE